MVTVAVVTTPNTPDAPDSVPRRVFEEVPGIEIEIASLVPLGGRAIPYVWVWGETLDAFERVVVGFPEVSEVEVLERVDGGALYRVEWDVDSLVLQCVVQAGGTVVDAYGTVEQWELTIWFERGDDAADFQRCCRGRDVPIEVERIRTTADETVDDGTPVTTRQSEALKVAYENGYFERPRRTTQEELAEVLGISAAAAGNRLRRGTANMVESLLEDY